MGVAVEPCSASGASGGAPGADHAEPVVSGQRLAGRRDRGDPHGRGLPRAQRRGLQVHRRLFPQGGG
eukprot:6679852-Alexandrium_andersonii.AAC.1